MSIGQGEYMDPDEMARQAQQGFIDRAKPNPPVEDEEEVLTPEEVPAKPNTAVMPIERLLDSLPEAARRNARRSRS